MAESSRYQKLKLRLDPKEQIDYFAAVGLASAIEVADKEKIEQVLEPLKEKKYTHAILGCTHYPLISKFIQEYLQLETISPCLSVARRVQALLSCEKKDHAGPGSLEVFMTSEKQVVP